MAGVVCTVCGHHDGMHAGDCRYTAEKVAEREWEARRAKAEGDRLAALSHEQLRKLRAANLVGGGPGTVDTGKAERVRDPDFVSGPVDMKQCGKCGLTFPQNAIHTCSVRVEGLRPLTPLPSPAEAVLREHITYLREQLAGKDRWQEAELARLRAEGDARKKSHGELWAKNQQLRIELARAAREVDRLNKDNDREVDESWIEHWDKLADGG